MVVGDDSSRPRWVHRLYSELILRRACVVRDRQAAEIEKSLQLLIGGSELTIGISQGIA